MYTRSSARTILCTLYAHTHVRLGVLVSKPDSMLSNAKMGGGGTQIGFGVSFPIHLDEYDSHWKHSELFFLLLVHFTRHITNH